MPTPCIISRMVLASSLAWALGGCGTQSPVAPAIAKAATTSENDKPRDDPPPRKFADIAPAQFTGADRKAKLEATAPWLEAHFGQFFEDERLPGLAIGLVVDGELAQGLYFGEEELGGPRVTAGTAFRIGSVTKTMTSAAVLRLVQEGRLSIAGPVEELVPELRGLVYPSSDSPPITIGQLLTHTSGLPRLGDFDYTQPDRGPDRAEVLQSIEDFALTSAPDAEYRYSNLGYALLGIAIENASGAEYRAYVDRVLLAPLGMDATFWDDELEGRSHVAVGYRDEQGALQEASVWRMGAAEPAGGLYSTLEDLVRYAAWQLDAYPPRSDAERGPLPRATVRASHLPRRVTASDDGEQTGDASASHEAVGYAWHIASDRCLDGVVWHNGAVEGHRSAIYLLPTRGVALVGLTNGPARLDQPIRDALRHLAAEGVLPERAPSVSPALAHASSGITSLFNRWDEASYAALFDERFRAALGTDKVRAYFVEAHADHGECAVDTLLEQESAHRGTFLASCERGGIELEITLATDRVVGFVFRSRGLEPTSEQKRLGDALADAMSTGSAAACQRSFGSDGCALIETQSHDAGGDCRVVELERVPVGRARGRIVCAEARYEIGFVVEEGGAAELGHLEREPADPCAP